MLSLFLNRKKGTFQAYIKTRERAIHFSNICHFGNDYDDDDDDEEK